MRGFPKTTPVGCIPGPAAVARRDESSSPEATKRSALTLLLLRLALRFLRERKVVPPRLETRPRRSLWRLRAVERSGRHESLGAGVGQGARARRCVRCSGPGNGRRWLLSAGRPLVDGDGVRAGSRVAVTVLASLAVAATVAKRWEVLPHAPRRGSCE